MTHAGKSLPSRSLPWKDFALHYSWLLAAGGILFLDQLTKWLVRSALPLGARVDYLPFMALVHRSNTGAGFSILTGQNTLLAIAALLALAGVSAMIPSLGDSEKLLAGIFLGGIMGNLADRLLFQGVTDFILVHWKELYWPAFNIADAALTLSVLFFIIREAYANRSDSSKIQKD
ncbi:signal peptidase II [Candidatus Woesearchaeota archaeon]|nr:MAG: signal peptidase II [Candidatus Woesearchaeota archaeon]